MTRIRTTRQARAARDTIGMHREIARTIGAEAMTPRRANVELDREDSVYTGFATDTAWDGVVFAFRELRDPRQIARALVVLARTRVRPRR